MERVAQVYTKTWPLDRSGVSVGRGGDMSVSSRTCWLAYVVAFATVTVAAATGLLEEELGPFARVGAFGISATLIVYAFSFASDNSSVYDPFWCVLPLWAGFYAKTMAPGGFWFYEPRETLVLLLLWAWAVRFFVCIPWEGWTAGLTLEDWRYQEFRSKMPAAAYWAFSLSSFHLTPTLLVLGAFAPAARVILQGNEAPPLNLLDLLALVLTAGGIAIEGLADEQLRRFRANQGSKADGAACCEGLWRWSRHPNYFGECTFWSGLCAFGLSSGCLSSEPVLIAGTLCMWLFFRLASVPLMDARSLARRPSGYAAVMKTTSALVLWPPRNLPVS